METAERQGSVPRLGAYEVVRKLARGGMADLFLARTVTNTFERLVVIKKILPRFADNPRFVQLFHDEAKLANSLKHKNIVEVYDIGGTGGESYFAMEYLHGQDVRSILHRAWKREEKMPIKHGVLIATQVASALHYAHEKRRPDGTLLDIVHRDVSPSNVIVSYDGAVKLLDFGVAKAATSSVKTRTGTLKGKIAYMSPEQAKGGSIDRRSDVFSLGIVLWEMLTTTRLFRGENDLATLQLIINEAPRRPSEVNPEVPKELERIVLRALAQDPKQRFQTALELQQELEDFVRTQQLVQSSSSLGMYMSVLFQPEIASWKEAKAAGTALSEHLTHINERTTPISESEFIEAPEPDDDDYEEELDDDLEQAAISGSIETKQAWPRRAPTATPVLAAGQAAIPMPIGKAGSAPVLRPSAPAIVASASGALPPLGHVIAPTLPARTDPTRPPPTPVAHGTPRPELIAPRIDVPRDPTGPIRPLTPVAGVPIVALPISLPAPDALPFSEEQARRLRRQFFIAGGGLVGVLFLIAIIKGCAGGGDAPPPAQPAKADAIAPREPATAKLQEPPVVAPPPAILDAGVVAVPDAAAVIADEPAPPPEVSAASGSAAPVKKPKKRRTPVKESPLAPPRRK